MVGPNNDTLNMNFVQQYQQYNSTKTVPKLWGIGQENKQDSTQQVLFLAKFCHIDSKLRNLQPNTTWPQMSKILVALFETRTVRVKN